LSKQVAADDTPLIDPAMLGGEILPRAWAEPPISAELLVEQVTRHPRTAGALLQLLRRIEGLPVDRALAMESQCMAMLQGSAEHAVWLAARAPVESAPAGRVVTVRDGDVLRVTIDRPGALNAINRELRDGLHEAFLLAALDTDIARVELRSVGPAFSVGADLAEFGTTRDPATAHHIRSLTLPAHPLSRRPEIFDVYVQGACVGSALEMAAFAGRVTAAPGAWFQLPELAMGIIPGAGGCVSVPRRIGRARAALMMLSGKRINGRTALDWGLIDGIEDQLPVDPACLDLH
jgi:enoyl-CoA hydratase/carnithine racemase